MLQISKMGDLHYAGVRLHIKMSAKAENCIKISKPTEERPAGLENSVRQHLLCDVSHFLNKMNDKFI